MFQVFSGVWALLLGIVLIMLGNGMHFTLIGLRGGVEGFSALELSIVASGYFMGFLSGARYTPVLIRRVGHVRVFCRAGQFHVGGADRLSAAGGPMVLDDPAYPDRVLHVGHLCCRRKLAEQCRQQRKPGQGAIGLYDRADHGHYWGARAFWRWATRRARRCLLARQSLCRCLLARSCCRPHRCPPPTCRGPCRCVRC